MKKIKLEVHKTTPIKNGIVRIDEEAIAVIHAIQAETGLSARKIVSEMVKQGERHIEITEV